MARLKTIEWAGDSVRIIDQTRLPGELLYDRIENVDQMYHAIKILKVRGAPAIGIAAAYGLYLAIRDFPAQGPVSDFIASVNKYADYLASSRPTAVNLFWALDRMRECAAQSAELSDVNTCKDRLLNEAHHILEDDRRTGIAIGEAGLELLRGKHSILTHCNAGGLATAEYGTALAPIYVGAERGIVFHVFADETRPLLQGARITAFELKHAGIPVTLICDNMAASLMAQGKIDAVIVGADRITANGDVANKIGTYGVAVLARAHSIPFYVAAPYSTFDISLSNGSLIPIEQRDPDEVTCGFGKRTAPIDVDVYNPAFDVTPSDLVTAIITDKGVLRQPYFESISRIFKA